MPNTPLDILTTEPVVYRLAVNDEIEVRLGDRADLIQTLRVQPDGMIFLHDLPKMQAEGRTTEQLQMALRRAIEVLTRDSGRDIQPVYSMNVGDEIEVRFTYYPALNQIVRIRPDGKVSLPYIKTVQAEGVVPEYLAQDLQQRYREYLKLPDITVSVRNFTSYRVQVKGVSLPAGIRADTATVALRSFASPQVYIAGEVPRQGILAYRPGLTLLRAIIEAGGNLATGEMRNVVVLRRTVDGGGLMIRRDLQSDLRTGLKNDIPLLASDIVIVPKTQVANLAQVVDQYLYQVIAPLRNSTFGFVYNINR